MKTVVMMMYLMLPHPSTNIGVVMELIPNQIQFMYENGLQVSYPYQVNDCRTLKPLEQEYVVKMRNEQVCYVVDANNPALYRSSQWMSAQGKTYGR